MPSAFGTALVLLLGAATASAQHRDFSRTVDLTSGGSLRVVGTKGSMRITSWDEPRVEVRARIERPDGVDDDYAARAVEATKIEITGDARSVTVATDYESVPTRTGIGRWGERTVPPVHYDVRAPRRIRLSVNSDRGPADVSGFEGAFDIVIDRGELHLRDLSGEVSVEIDRGEHSRLQGLRGSLRLEADRTDLEIDAPALDRESRIEIDRGDVEIRMPDAQRLTVRTDISRRGHFRTDFPIEWSSPDPRQSEGRINGGGAELFVESDRATVELRRRRN